MSARSATMTAIEIAIAVVEQDGRFLVGRRRESAALAGYWEFPGGKVEAGESAAEAACRECLEETGIAIEIVAEYPSRLHRYHHGELMLRFFEARPGSADTTPHGGFVWVDRHELAQLSFPAGNDQLLQRLLTPGHPQ